jgi:GNAT superfamily N-acetyltransferase
MRLTLEPASPDDVPAILALREAVAQYLTQQYGKGPWSSIGSERGVLYHMRTSMIYVARAEGDHGLIASLRLCTKKPWAIDTRYFSACSAPVYLTDMAVTPTLQRRGLGRLCLQEASRLGREWPADAIRLDAFDAAAGAGEFYRKCGYAEVGRVTYRSTPLIYFERFV